MFTKAQRYDLFLLLADKAHEIESTKPQPADACDPQCPGWAIFEVNREPGREVERCDACARFATDDDAIEHVLRLVYGTTEHAQPMLDGCADADCMLCRKRAAGICDCGACDDCTAEPAPSCPIDCDDCKGGQG